MTARLPPYASFLGVSAEVSDAGEPQFLMPFSEAVLGRPGFLHGGAIAGLLEIAAVGSLLYALGNDDGVHIKPINVTVNFMRGGRDHDTRAAARVSRLGNRVANVEAFAWQSDRDRPIATAYMNLMLRRDA